METPSYSIGRVALLAYLILASPYCSNLFSSSLKEEIESNRYAQHLILLTLIITLLTMFGNPFGFELGDNELLNSVITGLFLYIWIIFTTKLSLKYNVGILIILFLYFLYESKKISVYRNIKDDTTLTISKKEELINEYNKNQKYLLWVIGGITLVGVCLNFNTVKTQQTGGGGKINYLDYFFKE
jgi:hypothetical protein